MACVSVRILLPVRASYNLRASLIALISAQRPFILIAWVAQVTGWDSSALQNPTPPPPPQRPNPEFGAASFRLGSHSAIAGLDFPGLRDVRPARDPEEPEVRVLLRPEHGHLIHAKLSRLKHGQRMVLGTFHALFGSWKDVSPFEVEYTLSASELPEKLDGKIPLLVNKSGGPPGGEVGGDPIER